MVSLCGLECCEACSRRQACGGCQKTGGRPFGGTCFAAECVRRGGLEELQRAKAAIISESNALGIAGLEVSELCPLNGFFVNLAYPVGTGQCVKLLRDDRVYLGTQIEIPGSDRCYGVVADDAHLLVGEYGCHGEDPEIVLYKRR